MPLSSDDYAAFVRELLTLLEQLGLNDLGRRARERTIHTANNRDAAVELVRAIRDGVLHRSSTAYEAALDLSREFIRTESGRPIEDIEIIPTDRDRDLFGMQSTSLRNAPDVSRVVDTLNEVIAALENDTVDP
jgi:hypothetical protein